jgi:hypothetical protein
MDPGEVGAMIRQAKMGREIIRYAEEIPWLEVEHTIKPVTRQVLQVELKIKVGSPSPLLSPLSPLSCSVTFLMLSFSFSFVKMCKQ